MGKGRDMFQVTKTVLSVLQIGLAIEVMKAELPKYYDEVGEVGTRQRLFPEFGLAFDGFGREESRAVLDIGRKDLSGLLHESRHNKEVYNLADIAGKLGRSSSFLGVGAGYPPSVREPLKRLRFWDSGLPVKPAAEMVFNLQLNARNLSRAGTVHEGHQVLRYDSTRLMGLYQGFVSDGSASLAIYFEVGRQKQLPGGPLSIGEVILSILEGYKSHFDHEEDFGLVLAALLSGSSPKSQIIAEMPVGDENTGPELKWYRPELSSDVTKLFGTVLTGDLRYYGQSHLHLQRPDIVAHYLHPEEPEKAFVRGCLAFAPHHIHMQNGG